MPRRNATISSHTMLIFLTAVSVGFLSIAQAGRIRDPESPQTPLLGGATRPAPPLYEVAGTGFHLERPDDPPAAPFPGKSVTPAVRWTRSSFVSVQVNVDAAGNNIIGDAANEPSIAVDPTNPGRIVIGWRQFDTVTSNFRQAGWAYSHDSGQTWTFPGVLEPGVFRSDPVLDADANGTIYYYSLALDFGCQLFRSADGGLTWSGPISAYGGDKPWMAIDRTNGIGRGNIYCIWSPFVGWPEIFTRSTNGGETFMAPIDIPGDPWWGTIAVGPDGEVYVVGGEFVVANSTTAQDPGAAPTFDFSVSVDLGGGIAGGGPNPAGLLGQPWIAVDHSNGPNRGNVYVLCSVDPSGADPLDVHFVRSTDGGATWGTPIRVNDDPPGTNAWQWFGTMSVAPNGRIDAVWNDTRNNPSSYTSILYYAFSTDAGLTWSPNVPVSPSFNPSLGYPNQNKLGDYYDMVSDNLGAHVAYAATFNGEQDVYYLRIGDFDCNGNEIPDSNDVAAGTSGDCNGNGVPDECEPDCNTNGIVDACDITGGTSNDCNATGVPDECEIADGVSTDCNANGIPDECEQAALITSHPTAQTPCPGATATFTVTAVGATAYRWYKDGTPLSDGGDISGATTDTLIISNADATDEGVYKCKVSSGCIEVFSDPASLTLASVPSQSGTLSDLDKCEGEPAAFIANFTGTPPLSYQWEKDGTPLSNGGNISGATTDTLTIDPVTAADGGDYRCKATNACGFAYTNTATLAVDPAPTITDQPDDTCAEVGETAVFTVAATGPGSLWYQWLKDGFDIPGEGGWDHTTLTLSNVQPGDAGQYSVYVVSSVSPTCVVYSDEAALTVGGCGACQHATAGDMDDDGDVDFYDFALFQACFGPGMGLVPNCECANLDAGDNDVDLNDFALWEAEFTGPTT